MSPTYSICAEHGYLDGEQAVCPVCGRKTEVYSRITGYYRPVQNWNDGKTQEFRDRLEYDIEKSYSNEHEAIQIAKEIADGARAERQETNEKVSVKERLKEQLLEDGLYLITTTTCPNCAMAKERLNEAGIDYKVINADEEPQLARKLKVMQAPTIVSMEDGHMEKVQGVSNVLKYINEARTISDMVML